MANATRIDPYLNFKFRVEINGIQTAAFSEVTLPDSTVDAVTYREGTDPNYVRQLSGLTKYGSLSLKKGLTDSLELYNWFLQVSNKGAGSAGARKNISIIMVNDENEDACRWNIINAWPTKYESGGFNASSNDVLIETLDIVIESITRVA